MRRSLVVVIAIAVCLGSFFLGTLREKMKESLRQEESYAWDLHRKIKDATLPCDKLLAAKPQYPFHVEPIDDGKALLVANYNKDNHVVVVTILDAEHRIATDSWELECR